MNNRKAHIIPRSQKDHPKETGFVPGQDGRAGLLGHVPGNGPLMANGAPEAAVSNIAPVLLRRKKLILIIVSVFMGLWLLIRVNSTPIYESSATVRLNTQDRNITLSLSDPLLDKLWWGMAFQARENYLTQMELIRSRRLAARVVKRLEGKYGRNLGIITGIQVPGDGQNSGSVNGPENKRVLIDMVRGMVTVSEAPGSKLINLKVRHKDPRVARDVMNAYIEEHTEWETFKRKRVSLEALKFLEKQLQDTQDALLLSLERLVSFTRDNGIVAMEGRGNHLSAFFQRASSMLAEADLQRKRARADQGRALEGGSASAFAGELARLESQYSSKTAIYNDDHPSVALLKKRLDAIKRKISSAKERTAQSRRRALDRRMDAQRELFQSAKDAGARVDELRVRYEILKRDVEKNERLFSMLSVRLNGVNMELKSITSPLTVVDPPSTPSEPMASKSLSMLLGLAMIGLLSGSFLAVCLELGPAKIRDATQLRHEVRARVLGVIPAANEIKTGYFEKTSKRDAIGAINGDPRSSVSEALRGVETVTSALMLEKCMRSLVVTSLYPSEGRTFISASLASALSSRHGNVLVVDSDLRASGMGRVFRIPEHAAGLSDILRGEVDEFDYRKLVRKSRVKGLFFLPSGPPSSNPAALLASKKMRDLAAILSEDFDMVVFDSPPSQVFADSGAILRVAHALALVLEAGKTDAQDLNRAISGIPGAREKLLGFILNKADTRYLKYGRYGYYGYKSYSKVA